MYKYTTPTFTLTLPEGTDLGLASEVVCTLAHDGKEVNRGGSAWLKI